MIDFIYLMLPQSLEDGLHPAGFAGRDTFPPLGSTPPGKKSLIFTLAAQAVACVS